MDTGWVKIHRKLLENPIMHKPAYLSLWVTLLLRANHKENKMIWNNNIMVIKEGQFITGRDVLSKQTGIHPSTIDRILNYFENEQQIEQQTTNKFRLITIVNWKTHQDTNIKMNNQRTTSEQPVNTNKNAKNAKNVKNDNKNTSEINSPEDSKNINEVISSFKDINGEFQNFFKNKTQRESALYLVNKYTLQKVKKAIYVIDFNFADSFCPKAINPFELKTKWSKIAMYHIGKCRKTPEYEKEFEKFYIEKEKKNNISTAPVKKLKAFVGGAEVSFELQDERS